MRPAALLLLAFLVPQAGWSASWAAFRGNDASGVAEGAGPTTWNVERSVHVAWKTAIPGLGHSSPVIWDERIFITTAVSSAPQAAIPQALNGNMESANDSAPQSWRVFCLDRKTGRILWERVVHEGVPRSRRHPRNSFATPTPATDGKHLVVLFGGEGLLGLDLDGKILWRQDLGPLAAGSSDDSQYQWGFASSPVLYGDLVLVQADIDRDPFLAAYDLQTGKPVWKTARADRQSWSTPTVTHGLPEDELVTIAPRAVRGYNPKTGQELWHLDWNMSITESTPVWSGGVLYLASGKGDRQPILALKPGARGDITPQPGKPRDPHIVWLDERGGPITTSPLVHGDYLYALTDQGVLRCLARATGEVVYTQRLPDEFLSSPVLADGKLYLTSVSGDIYVVREGPQFHQLAMNPMDEIAYATPALAAGLLVVRTQRFLYGIAEPPAAGTGGTAGTAVGAGTRP